MEFIKRALDWIWRNLGNLALLGGALSSFIVPAWAALRTGALAKYAPFSWVFAGFFGLLLAVIGWWLFSLGYEKIHLAKRNSQIAEKFGVNTLEQVFSRKTIRLIDFYRPQYLAHRDKDFRDCEICGPGLVAFLNGVNMTGGRFKHVQIIVVREDQLLWGMTVFDNARFVNCDILNVTMMMSRMTYENLPEEVRENVPVINAQWP